MGSPKRNLWINRGVLGVAVIAAVATLYGGSLYSHLRDQNKEVVQVPTGKFSLPAGSETYRIVQAEEIWPKILEATIDPPDVHVGDVQKLTVVIQGPDEIASVEARTQLDHEFKVIPLKFTGEIAAGDLQPNSYYVNKNGKLAVVGRFSHGLRATGYGLSAASAAEYPKLKYEAEWTVHDTHDEKYNMAFVVKDVKDRENSVTLAWSDACAIPVSGAWNLGTFGNCTIASADGVEAGNVTIATWTLTLNASFAWNPGNSITVSSGSIAIGSGGSLVESYVWSEDTDSDNYASSTGMQVSATDPGVSWSRRSSFNGYDCYDSNAQAKPGQTAYFATHRGDGSFDYDCNSTEGKEFNSVYSLSCSSYPACSNIGNGDGWSGSVPACGVEGQYLSRGCSAGASSCQILGNSSFFAQTCR